MIAEQARREFVVIESIQREPPFSRSRRTPRETPDRRIRLHTRVSLVIHVETVLGPQHGRVGDQRAMALTGHLRLPELRAEIAFCDQRHGGRNLETHWGTAAVVPRTFTMPIPLQYVALPAARHTDVWALTPSPSHDAPWMEHYAGRLGTRPIRFDQYLAVTATVDVAFAPRAQDGSEARVDIAGELRFEQSMVLRLRFRDPKQSMALPSESGSAEALLIAAGARVPLPRQTVSSSARHGPRMTVRVLETDGRVAGAEPFRDGSPRRTP